MKFSGPMTRTHYQRGHVRKTGRKTKYWEGSYLQYIEQPDGTQQRKQKWVKLGPITLSKGEARAKLAAIIAGESTEPLKEPETVTLAELWARYSAMKRTNWAESTRRTVTSVIETYILPIVGNLLIKEITITPLQACVSGAVEQQRSSSALRKIRTYLIALFEFAIDEGVIRKNPARKIELPKRMRRPKSRFLTIEECRKILSVAVAPREHLILRIFMVAGLRPGELFALRRNDILPGKIRIDEAVWEGVIGDPKTEGSVGTVHMSEPLEEEMKSWLEWHPGKPEDLLFPSRSGTPISPNNYLKRTISKLAKAAGIDGVTHQSLRRTCATYFRNTKSAQAQLRHTSASVTRDHYEGVIPEDQKAAVEALDAELCGGQFGKPQ